MEKQQKKPHFFSNRKWSADQLIALVTTTPELNVLDHDLMELANNNKINPYFLTKRDDDKNLTFNFLQREKIIFFAINGFDVASIAKENDRGKSIFDAAAMDQIYTIGFTIKRSNVSHLKNQDEKLSMANTVIKQLTQTKKDQPIFSIFHLEAIHKCCICNFNPLPLLKLQEDGCPKFNNAKMNIITEYAKRLSYKKENLEENLKNDIPTEFHSTLREMVLGEIANNDKGNDSNINEIRNISKSSGGKMALAI